MVSATQFRKNTRRNTPGLCLWLLPEETPQPCARDSSQRKPCSPVPVPPLRGNSAALCPGILLSLGTSLFLEEIFVEYIWKRKGLESCQPCLSLTRGVPSFVHLHSTSWIVQMIEVPQFWRLVRAPCCGLRWWRALHDKRGTEQIASQKRCCSSWYEDKLEGQILTSQQELKEIHCFLNNFSWC